MIDVCTHGYYPRGDCLRVGPYASAIKTPVRTLYEYKRIDCVQSFKQNQYLRGRIIIFP